MQAIAPLLAGLGLFFCGIHFVSTNLVPLAGRRFRALLARMGRRPWTAAAFGSLAGVITQSTNAVTAVTIGLVSGGLVDKQRAILIPTWAHVGTSMLVILAALDLRAAAGWLVALAVCTAYFGLDRNDRLRHVAGTLLGVGLLFLGLQMLRSGAEPLRDLLVADGLLAAIGRAPPLLMGLGAAVSMLCQSSSIASALAVAATGAGQIDFAGACWLIYGANLGSGLNYAMFARKHRGEAAQIALMQVAQKLLGFVVMLLITAVELATGWSLIENAAGALATTPAGKLAWVFLAYQVFGSVLCTLLFSDLMVLLERLAPPGQLQELSKPAYLVEEALVEPSFAIELVLREERRLLERVPGMLDAVRADADGPLMPAANLRAAADAITGAMARYLDSIVDANPSRSDREQLVRLQHRTANLGAIYDALDEFVTTSQTARSWPSSAQVTDRMIESLHALLTALVEATAANDPSERELLLALLGHRDETMERIRQRVLKQDPDIPPKAQEALFAATMLFERIIWLARRSTLLLTPDPAQTHLATGAAA